MRLFVQLLTTGGLHQVCKSVRHTRTHTFLWPSRLRVTTSLEKCFQVGFFWWINIQAYCITGCFLFVSPGRWAGRVLCSVTGPGWRDAWPLSAASPPAGSQYGQQLHPILPEPTKPGVEGQVHQELHFSGCTMGRRCEATESASLRYRAILYCLYCTFIQTHNLLLLILKLGNGCHH